MATWDSADLLAEFNKYAGRPTSGDEISDATKYARLSKAQLDVISDIAAIYPYCMYRSGGPTATTTSGGIVHTFGTDGNGTLAMGPIGHVWIGRSASRYPDVDLIEGVDYLNEGTQIRMLNERVEPALYWTGIPTPADISASAEPSLRPAPARILIVIKAVENFAREGSRNVALADEMEHMWAKQFPKWMLTLKTQFRQGGALSLDGLDRAILRGGNLT